MPEAISKDPLARRHGEAAEDVVVHRAGRRFERHDRGERAGRRSRSGRAAARAMKGRSSQSDLSL